MIDAQTFKSTTVPAQKKDGTWKTYFAAIQKWPVGNKAMLRNLYEMFVSAEDFEQKHPEVIEQVDRARARSKKETPRRSARKYASRSARAKTN